MSKAPPVERLLGHKEIKARLQGIEASTRKLLAGAESVPRMVTVLSFADDPPGAVLAYVEALRALWAATPELPHIERLHINHARHPGLKPDWVSPAAWIDYVPSPEERADRRPDLRPPMAGRHSRKDWKP